VGFYINFFSGQGDTMISILIDLNGFWTYENREAMAADTNDGPAEVWNPKAYYIVNTFITSIHMTSEIAMVNFEYFIVKIK